MKTQDLEEKTITRFKTTSVAFDLGAYEIRVAIVGRTDTGITKLIFYGSVPSAGLELNKVTNSEKLTERLQELMVQVRNALPSNAEVLSAFIGYSGEDLKIHDTDAKWVVTKSKKKKLNHVTYYDLDKLRSNYARFVMDKNFVLQGLIPAGYCCDDNVWTEQVIGKPAKIVKSRYYAIALPNESWNKISTAFRKILIGPREVSFPPLTADKVILEPEERQNNPVVIDIGLHQTSVLYYHQYRWKYHHTIPLGSYDINDAIVKTLKENEIHISYDQAEYLKRKYGLENPLIILDKNGVPLNLDTITLDNGQVVSHKLLSKIIQKKMYEIIDQAIKEIEQEEEGKNILISSVVFIGGGSDIKGMDDFVQSCFEVPTKIGKVTNIADLTEEAKKASAVNVLGLAIYGLEVYRSTRSFVQKSLSWFKGKNNTDFIIEI